MSRQSKHEREVEECLDLNVVAAETPERPVERDRERDEPGSLVDALAFRRRSS